MSNVDDTGATNFDTASLSDSDRELLAVPSTMNVVGIGEAVISPISSPVSQASGVQQSFAVRSIAGATSVVTHATFVIGRSNELGSFVYCDVVGRQALTIQVIDALAAVVERQAGALGSPLVAVSVRGDGPGGPDVAKVLAERGYSVPDSGPYYLLERTS
jgi:hypothetical protein